MGIFDKIKNAIFGSAKATEGSPPAARPASLATAGAPSAPVPGSGSGAPISQVDVEAVLTTLAAQKTQKLDWRKSIVDLMKLLDLDSSFTARQELAKELGYTGDPSDSASMNVWLHKQVMAKLAASGGKVPEDLRT
jgi:hypothetical protein